MFPRAASVILFLLVGFIVTLAVIGFVRLARANEAARHMRVLSDTHAINTQLKLYYTETGSFPKTEQGLQVLVEKRLFAEIVKDPWNTDYTYRCPGKKHPDGYDLFSSGPDRKPDTADDDWGE